MLCLVYDRDSECGNIVVGNLMSSILLLVELGDYDIYSCYVGGRKCNGILSFLSLNLIILPVPLQ